MKFPEWATEKQKEGMRELISIIEFGNFDITFKQSEIYDDEEHRFFAVFEWENHSCKKEMGRRHHEIEMGWGLHEFWDKHGDKIHSWQFIFSGGDCCYEISNRILFLDLFFYLDGIAKT